jgi:hypothetical protein
MSPRLLRPVLTTVVLIAALALPLSAQAAGVQSPAIDVAGPAFLADLTETFRHWFAHLWCGTFEKNGAQIDPNGATTPAGTANGGTPPAERGDNGAMVDPNG